MPIHNRPQRLDSITFKKLKNLNDITISFKHNGITGIFGSNGCGKSTVLHALACIFKPVGGSSRIDYKFSSFFLPTTLGTWSGSEFNIQYSLVHGDGNMHPAEPKIYKKENDRWSPKYSRRPLREIFYIGINSCVPDMEKETRKSKLQLLEQVLPNDDIVEKIKRILSYVMNRSYDEIKQYGAKNKIYKGLKFSGTTYPSLYMGAGEQRILEILRIVLNAPDYSLILIDEVDLTLHTEALLRLIEQLNAIANDKNLQIVFTSHREELLMCDFIDVRHLINDPTDGNTKLCINRTTPECIRRITGQAPRTLEFLVEDDLAETLVRKVLRQKNIEAFCTVIRYGSIENSFRVGAGLILRGETLENTLIITDGDQYRDEASKRDAINQMITGRDPDANVRRDLLFSKIKQFRLPRATNPETYITDKLKTLGDELSPLIPLIRSLGPVANNHDLLNIPINNSGMPKEIALSHISDLLSTLPEWENYVKEVSDWVDERIIAANLQ